MLGIFGIVAAEEGPRSVTVLPMYVLDPRCTFLVREDRNIGLQAFTLERGGQAIEISDHIPVVLNQHRRNRIDLGAEVEQGRYAERLPFGRIVDLVPVDVGEASRSG